MRRGTAADNQVTPVGVGAAQLHLWFGVQIQTRGTHPPSPRLRVVDGGCPVGQREDHPEGFGVREVGLDCCHPSRIPRPPAAAAEPEALGGVGLLASGTRRQAMTQSRSGSGPNTKWRPVISDAVTRT